MQRVNTGSENRKPITRHVKLCSQKHGSPFFRLPENIRREDWDLFDLQQLENVLAICRQSKSMAEAGRALFNVSRNSRSTPNDSDRLRKYLARFGLTWADAVA